MNTRRFVSIAFVTCSLLFMKGWAQTTDASSDLQLQFTKSYAYKTYLKDDAIKITARDGVVILAGEVSDEFHKSLALNTAAAMPGVTRVDDRLVVTGQSPEARSDQWVAANVKTALGFHRYVSASRLKIEVRNGVVTLRGEAPNQAQKDLTTEYAQDVDGVQKVVNEMTVAANSPAAQPINEGQAVAIAIDDASITAQIKEMLLAHRSTSALNAKVTTTNGVVTITGLAESNAEKDLITQRAEDVVGATKVINEMLVRASTDD